MQQDFIPPLIYAESPHEGSSQVGRAATFHIICVDVGNDEAQLDPLTLSISVHYPDTEDPPLPVYVGGEFTDTSWKDNSSLDMDSDVAPTRIHIFLRNSSLLEFDRRVSVVVSVSDVVEPINETTRTFEYAIRSNSVYEGGDTSVVEEMLLEDFGIPQIDEFSSELFRLLVDSSAVPAESFLDLSVRRALTILSRLRMCAVPRTLFNFDPAEYASEVLGARSMTAVLEEIDTLLGLYGKLEDFLLLRRDLCPEGYLQFIRDCRIRTKPQTTIGAFITLLMILHAVRVQRGMVR